MLNSVPTKENIIDAHDRIKTLIHKTPLLTCSTLNRISGAELFFKCENFQKIGAFKFRGASNVVAQLNEKQLAKGVGTHSSGNHAAALSLAAKKREAPAKIVMPHTAPDIKKNAVREYGADIIFCEPTVKDRETTMEEVMDEFGVYFVHPYDNYDIIAGQATCAKEIIEEEQNLDAIICPVGGGGIMSGTCLSGKYFSPNTIIIGAEPSGADDAYRSLRDKKIYPSINPNTIADGLLTQLSEKTYGIISENIERIITVEENEIKDSMRLVWERMKIIIEPSAAVSLAALLKEKENFAGKRVALVLTGGNIDLGKLPW